MNTNKKVIESKEVCPQCNSLFLKSHLCEKCKQRKNLLDQHNLLIYPDFMNFLSLKDVRDNDIIIIKTDLEKNTKEIQKEEIYEEAIRLSKEILQYTGKKIRFIIVRKGITIQQIPNEMFSKFGLKRITPEDKKDVDIS